MQYVLPMRMCVIGMLFFMGALHAHARVPNLITQTSLHDVTQVQDPTLSQSFYGEMTGFPHTYEITSKTPFHLFAQIHIPDIDTNKNNVSGIIIKERPGGGRVIEVTRLLTKDASWTPVYEARIGDSYRQGPLFSQDLEAGTYRIEVETPDNVEKYVLLVGEREEMTIGYFELIGRVIGVKHFFGKSGFWVIQSPYVYVPLLVILSVSGYFWYRKRTSV